MKKRLLLIYIIGSILATIALFMSTNGALLGSYFFLGVIYSLCTLVIFNTFFFYLLHKMEFEDILKMSLLRVAAISFVTLVIPAIIEKLLCNYFYNYIFVDTTSTNYNIHERVLWFEPLCIHFYVYFCIFILLVAKRIINKKKKGSMT